MKRAGAGRFRDFLIAKNLTTSSIKRVFATVRAAVNLTIPELGLECTNSFSGTFIPEVGTKTVRPPVPSDVIRSVQRTCFEIDDDNRLLIARISYWRMLLAEALGLARDDLKLGAAVPHIDLQPHPWRSLKTASSTRTVPLAGSSLLAAQRLAGRVTGPRLFPRYSSGTEVNSNSASASLNKWLRSRLPDGCVPHSFRHCLRDRLRAEECPANRRLHILLRRDGVVLNHETLFRLYREERLTVAMQQGPNQRWSLELIADQLFDGRRLRVLVVVDDFTRECLALVVDTSLSGQRVDRELDALIALRGQPLMAVSDNGTEQTSRAILQWQEDSQVEWPYIAPGKPMQNGFVESLNVASETMSQRADVPQPADRSPADRESRMDYNADRRTRALAASPPASLQPGPTDHSENRGQS